MKAAKARGRAAIALMIFVLGMDAHALAAPGDIVVEFMASSVGWADGPSLGHAFACLALHLSSGVKEDCYGFYSKAGGADMFVGGPGVVANEFRKNPDRFAQITASAQQTIDTDRRRAVLAAIDDFNSRTYKLTETNCVALVDRVAKAAGMKSPPVAATTTPAAYVRALAALNP